MNKIKLEVYTCIIFKDISSIQSYPNYPSGFNKFLLYNENYRNN